MGRVVVTKGIDEAMRENQKFAMEVNLSLQRYAVKDWEILMQKISRPMMKH